MGEKALPEPFSAEHLRELRQRWERDPKSRAFLQLAEEYRRAGQLEDAVHVLRAGLDEHPTYLSAQVALGRCLMESGLADAAAEILERAVARDPTQLVANKLLVEAYLAKGQPAKASERLNLYKLFNDRDAEIELLEARIRTLQGLPAIAAGTKKGAIAPPIPAPSPALDDSPFDLPAVAGLPEVALEPVSATWPSGSAPAREPFGRVYAAGAAQRIESAFAQQGIFPLAPPAAPALSPRPVPLAAVAPIALVAPLPPLPPLASLPPLPPLAPIAPDPSLAPPAPGIAIAPAANVEWESEAWPAAAAPGEETVADPLPAPDGVAEADLPPVADEWAPELDAAAELAEPAAGGEPAALAEPTPTPVLPVSAAAKPASATLGELYLAQGHLDEAEDSFRSVLQSRPGDSAALAGLDSVRQQRGDEATAFAEELPGVEESNVIVGGLTARKAALLKDYLERIRRGARRHVS